MSKTIQEQLEVIKPQLSESPMSAARADAEAFFQGEITPQRGGSVDWQKVYSEEVRKVLGAVETRENVEITNRRTDIGLKWGITACLAGLAGSCVFMLKKACVNEDKSPKFEV